MLLDHYYAFGLLPYPSGLKKKFLEEGDPPWHIFACSWSAPGWIWPKNNSTCKRPWVLHLYQVSSKSIKRFWRRSWKCETVDGRTDGRTSDCALWQYGSGELKWIGFPIYCYFIRCARIVFLDETFSRVPTPLTARVLQRGIEYVLYLCLVF